MKIGIDIRELEGGKMTGIGHFVCGFVRYTTAARSQSRFFLYRNQRTDTGFIAPNITLRIVAAGMTIRSGSPKCPALGIL